MRTAEAHLAITAETEAAVLDGERPRRPFEEYRDTLVHQWMKIISLLGVSLVPLFLVVDWFTLPREGMQRFVMFRGVTTLLLLVQLLVLRATKPNRFSFLHGYVFGALVGGMIVWMTVDLGGFTSGYYIGLMLVIFPVNVLLPWRSVHSAINGGLTLAMYVTANAMLGGPYTSTSVVHNVYFLAAAVIIVIAMSETRYRLILKEFSLRAELEASNQSLETSQAALKSARDSLWSEMEVAQRIQTALLPRNGTLGSYEAAAVMRPAAEVGGDYYDFIDTRHGEHWLTVGDVSGHGVESGLVMMMAQTSIATLVNDAPGRSPSEIFARTNRIIRENVSRLGASRYMTLNVIRLEPNAAVVAGKHQDLLVWRQATNQVEVIANEGSWIGVVDDVSGATEDLRIPVGPGDWMLLYTDGITEARSSGGELYGEERLRESFARHAGRVALPRAVEQILDDARRFTCEQEDDMTLVVVRRKP